MRRPGGSSAPTSTTCCATTATTSRRPPAPPASTAPTSIACCGSMASSSAELTPRAIAIGLALGAPVAAANVYAGLVLGFVDAGAMAIILVAFAAFGGRRLTAGEVNVAQVAGSSAGAMAVTAGLIGPVPALAMTGHDVAPAIVALWGCALAVLGTLVAIPFRDSLIAVQRLAF